MSDPSLPALAAAAAVSAAVVGVLKTSVGGGIGLVLTPILTLFLPPQVVLGLTAVQLSLSDPITLRYYWGQWDRRSVRVMLLPLLAGVLLGGWGLGGLSELSLRRAIGVTALSGALLQLALLGGALRVGAARIHWWAGGLVGLLAGLATVIAHSAGIVIGPYLLGLGLGNAAVVATVSALVVLSNVLKLVTYWGIGFLGWPLVVVSLATAPALYLAAWAGYRLNRWLPRRWFALALIVIAIAGSLRLLLT